MADKAPSTRLVSMDALRGFDMFWITGGGDIIKEVIKMISNPMPAAIAFHFDHVEWQGFAAWDLIMPLFLFIVGAALPYSMSKHVGPGADRKGVYKRIFRRFAILFILGIAVQGNLFKFDIGQLHLFCNTLQAIAVGYLVASILILNVGVLWQAIACAALLAGYWAIMVLVPIPGHGAGHIEPHLNLALYIDKAILGRFQDGTSYTWILSGMTFSASVLLGVFAGYIMRSKLKLWNRFFALLGAGAGCIALGLVISIWFPIIKHIWSSSFALFAAGLSYLLLAVFYLIMDIVKIRKWAFLFTLLGTNALFAYLYFGIVLGNIPPSVGDYLKSVSPVLFIAAGLSMIVGLWVILYFLNRKKWYLRV